MLRHTLAYSGIFSYRPLSSITIVKGYASAVITLLVFSFDSPNSPYTIRDARLKTEYL